MTRTLLTTVAILATLSASARGSAITGTVRAGAKPASQVTVRILNKKHAPARTDAAGHFTFTDLTPGHYTLFVTTKRHGFARAKFILNPSQTFDIVLPLRHPRPHHVRDGGVATPGHTPGHTAGFK